MKGRTLITSAVAWMIFQMPRQIWTPGWGGRGFRQIAASFYLTKLWGRLNEYLPSYSEDNGFKSGLWYRLNWLAMHKQPRPSPINTIRYEIRTSFRHEEDENCALLGYYVASSGNFLSTFRDNLSVPSSVVENPSNSLFIRSCRL